MLKNRNNKMLKSIFTKKYLIHLFIFIKTGSNIAKDKGSSLYPISIQLSSNLEPINLKV